MSHKNSNIQVCVIRTISPNDNQFVPINEVPFFEVGERVFVGQFSSHKENHGPSGSHERTICQPSGPMVEATIPERALNNGKLVDTASIMQCVLREVEPGDTQFVPVGELPYLNPGERLFTGVFRTQKEKHGPSGSHVINIALPFGAVSETRAQLAA